MNDFNAFAAPITKLIELNKSQFEKLAAAQQEAAKNYIQLTEARMKAASGIKDADALNAFAKEQVELAKSGFEKVQADSKVLVEDVKSYNEEVIKLVQEGNAVVTKEVKATVKKAAKKAA